MLERHHRILPAAPWWGGLLFIVLVGAALRFTGIGFSLPYVDHPDEASYTIAARLVVDAGSPKPIGMQGYPPGFIAVNLIAVRLLHDASLPAVSVLLAVRVVAASFAVGCIAMVGLLAYRVHSPLAGWIAAALWALAPAMIEHGRYATADSFVTFFALLALFLATSGARFDRNDLLNGGLIAALLAVSFKYQAIFILPIVLALPLARWFTPQVARGRVWRTTGTHLLITALFAAWLVLLFPALEASQSPNWTAAGARFGLPTPATLAANAQVTLDALAPLAFWGFGWAGLLLFAWPRLRRHVDGLALAAVALSAAAWLIGVSFYGALGPQELRQFIALGALFEVLRAVGLGAWGLGLATLLAERAPARAAAIRLACAAFVAVGTLAPHTADVRTAVLSAWEHTLPDQRNALASYADGSLDGGPVVATVENHKTLNRDWGGYAGRDVFPLHAMADASTRPVAAWQAEGARYAIVPYTTLEAARAGGSRLLDDALLLKTYAPSADFRGPSMAVLALWRPQAAADAALGPIRLVGFDVSAASAAPGDVVEVRLYWQAEAAPPADYAVFVHLAGADGVPVAQADGAPLAGGRGTHAWDDPGEVLISRGVTLGVPVSLPPGQYDLRTGFYDPATGARLAAPDGADHIRIGQVRISNG